MNFANQQVLVIGAAGALGSRFTQQLIAAGATVIGTAQTSEKLNQIDSRVAEKYQVDLESSSSIENFVNQLKQNQQKLSGVIIASGVVGFNSAEVTNSDEINRITQINYLGPSQLINALFPLLKSEGDEGSFVLGITGVVVEQTFPGMSAYTSSKAAFSAYLQSITKEWRRYKIKVTEARLGHTETGLANRAIFGSAPQMPTGLNPDTVVTKMLEAVFEKKNLISSAEFN